MDSKSIKISNLLNTVYISLKSSLGLQEIATLSKLVPKIIHCVNVPENIILPLTYRIGIFWGGGEGEVGQMSLTKY